MGRNARGVRGVRLRDGDEVVGMGVVPREGVATLLTVCEKGYGKRTPTADYPTKNRGGKGVITIKTTDRNGRVVALRIVTDEDDLMIITDGGKLIRMPVAGIPTIGRNTQGVRLIRLDDAERVVAMERMAEKEEGETIESPEVAAARVEALAQPLVAEDLGAEELEEDEESESETETDGESDDSADQDSDDEGEETGGDGVN
jgi:DNA gyrase subunit A